MGRICPPYTADCVKGDTAACNHVKKIVEKHTKERERRCAAEPININLINDINFCYMIIIWGWVGIQDLKNHKSIVISSRHRTVQVKKTVLLRSEMKNEIQRNYI